jgi:uncharacterized protein YmfQ (DUF2313 family)
MTHADLLKLLLPPEAIEPGGLHIGIELAAEGAALDAVQAAAVQLLEESDPRTTAALLPDFERVYGLPESYVTGTQSFGERRVALVAKATMAGAQSRQFFIDLAATIGYAITITEHSPHNTELDTEQPATGDEERFTWTVNCGATTVREATTEDDTEMATAVWGNDLLEAFINRYKPAHTLALFAYA